MSWIEPVARPAHRHEMPGLFGICLEALSQLADEVVDGAHRADRLSPDEVEQLAAREHLARVAQEEHEELELEVRQLHLAAAALYLALDEIDRRVVELEHVADRRDDRRRGRGGLGPAQHGIDARE